MRNLISNGSVIKRTGVFKRTGVLKRTGVFNWVDKNKLNFCQRHNQNKAIVNFFLFSDIDPFGVH